MRWPPAGPGPRHASSRWPSLLLLACKLSAAISTVLVATNAMTAAVSGEQQQGKLTSVHHDWPPTVREATRGRHLDRKARAIGGRNETTMGGAKNSSLAADEADDTNETQSYGPLLELNAFEAAQRGYFRHSIPASVVVTVAYSMVFIVGLLGNSFVVTIVYKSPRMRTATNYFIANLALADILVLLFCLPATLVGNLFIRKYSTRLASRIASRKRLGRRWG